MSTEEFNYVIKNGTSDTLEQMYQYGYACGLNNTINFSEIKDTFSSLSLTDGEAKNYLHKIIDGFKNASEFDTNVFFG